MKVEFTGEKVGLRLKRDVKRAELIKEILNKSRLH